MKMLSRAIGCTSGLSYSSLQESFAACVDSLKSWQLGEEKVLPKDGFEDVRDVPEFLAGCGRAGGLPGYVKSSIATVNRCPSLTVSPTLPMGQKPM